MMNSRQRMESTLAGLPTDTLPVAPIYLDLYLNERIRRNYLEAYRLKLAGAARCAIDHGEDCRFRAEAIIRAYQAFSEPPDWMHVAYGETHRWAEQGEVQVSDGHLWYVNRHTGQREDLEREALILLPASLQYIDPNDASTDRWGDELPDDERAIDQSMLVQSAQALEEQGVFDVARLLVEMVGERLYLRCETGTPYWFAYCELGFSGLMVMMHERPKLLQHIMARKHRQRLEVLKGFARAGVHAVWVEECLSSADLISPADYDRFVFPTTRAYIQDINQLGLDTILYYCGDVIPRLSRLRELGITALAVEESKKGFSVDIAEVIARLGAACAVFGNVDAVEVVQNGTPQSIEAEVRRQIQLGRQAKGFILAQGSPFPLDTEHTRIEQFIAAARRA